MTDVGKVRVTVNTQVFSTTGEVLTSITQVQEETGGNPLFVTRMAHRRAEACADDTRVMLGTVYGEPEAGWRGPVAPCDGIIVDPAGTFPCVLSAHHSGLHENPQAS